MQDYLDRAVPGASADYLVIPRALAQSMPLRWQQVFVGLLTDLHDAYGHLTWPEYRVVSSRWEIVPISTKGSSLSRGIHADLGPDGGLEYRDIDERLITNPERHRVLAPVDPLPLPSEGRRGGAARQAAVGAVAPGVAGCGGSLLPSAPRPGVVDRRRQRAQASSSSRSAASRAWVTGSSATVAGPRRTLR